MLSRLSMERGLKLIEMLNCRTSCCRNGN